VTMDLYSQETKGRIRGGVDSGCKPSEYMPEEEDCSGPNSTCPVMCVLGR